MLTLIVFGLLFISLMMWSVFLLTIYVVLTTAYKFRKHAKYFQEYGIPYLGTGLGKTAQFFMGATNVVQIEQEIYKEALNAQAPIVGLSDAFGACNVYIMDLDLIKDVYVKDFDHFVNRRPIGTKQRHNFFSKMLFTMENDSWKGVRAKLSPSFTSSKIRRMFNIFKKSSDQMERYVKAQIRSNQKSIDLDFNEIFPKYAMDVIASCAFGIDGKCWDVQPGRRSTFEQMGDQFQFSFKTMIKFFMTIVAPRTMNLLEIDVMDHESSMYFSGVIREVLERRRETGERRDDFLQLMMDAQEGTLKADEETSQVMNGSTEEGKTCMENNTTTGRVFFDDDDIIANGMLFLLAGFDTIQSVLIFTIYSLALEEDVQGKLYKEIKFVLEKYEGNVTYEAVSEMSYLDMVINESMRMYPPSAKAERSCTQDYAVPDTKFVIKKGTIVSIPIRCCHHDSRYFPNPDKFIPERFTSEGKSSRHPYAFMPFGHGPRNCVGMRFALVEVKTVIAQLVGSFQFAPCSKTKIPMEYDNTGNLKPKGGMWINVRPRF